MTNRGMLFLLSGPSGVGKGTVRKALFEESDVGLNYSISATTRKPRQGESDGIDYFFITREDFEKRIEEHRMLEYAEYAGNYYGTPKDWIDKELDHGKDVFMEIEVQGAKQVRKLMPEAIFIFLAPPDLVSLRARLQFRGTETDDVIDKRLEAAKQENEMMHEYDYVVVNDKVDVAATNIQQIINVNRMRSIRVAEDFQKVLEG
jgi:guanylate kinase